MKRQVRLTEGQLKRLIEDTARQCLTELDWKTYANASRKWANHLRNHPDNPRRKSNIIGHEGSTGDHDIPTDNRLRSFVSAMNDKFNDDFAYNQYDLTNGRNHNDGQYYMDWGADDIGAKGYYDRLRTKTKTPPIKGEGGTTHDLEDDFYLPYVENGDIPSEDRESYVSHKKDAKGNYRYVGKERTRRDSVEPRYDSIPYMKARNRGNQEIEDYRNGNYEYSKGRGWKLKGKK